VSPAATSPGKLGRVLGRIAGERPGPTLIAIGGLHGNEPAGTIAAPRVIGRLEEGRFPLRGEFLAVVGNLGALARGRRYREFDLNRCWLPDNLARLQRQDPALDRGEERELRELARTVEEARSRGGGPVTVIDLHTTSSHGPPFIVMSDTLRNRRLGLELLGTVFLGLEESVDGTLLEYMTEQGHTAALVEGGQHEDPRSVEVHESVLWMALAATGMLRPGEIPDLGRHRRFLRAAQRGTPRVVELRYRHDVRPGDGFRMKEGYLGFQEVKKGEVLARDRNGDVASPERGRIVMPLYQEQGEDGFFLVRPVNRFWMWVSRVVRRLRLGRVLPLLPGVSRIPGRPNALAVDARKARFYAVEIFHLFGYRKRSREGERLVFTRRRPG